MRVGIVGGGKSGAAIAAAVRARGADAVLLSRSTGFDVTEPGAARLLQSRPDLEPGVDAFIEAAGTSAASAKAATAFFTRSARTVAEAARLFGARHVLLSIVGAARPEVAGFGYYAGKAAQERAAITAHQEAGTGALTIVRTTQWFEFGSQMLRRLTFGPIALVPAMRMRPVALAAAADVIAEIACAGSSSASSSAESEPTPSDGDPELTPSDAGSGSRSSGAGSEPAGGNAGPSPATNDVDVAGPAIMMLADLVRALPRHPWFVASLPIPTAWGRAFRGEALIPGDGARIVGPTLAQWLEAASPTWPPRGRH